MSKHRGIQVLKEACPGIQYFFQKWPLEKNLCNFVHSYGIAPKIAPIESLAFSASKLYPIFVSTSKKNIFLVRKFFEIFWRQKNRDFFFNTKSRFFIWNFDTSKEIFFSSKICFLSPFGFENQLFEPVWRRTSTFWARLYQDVYHPFITQP